MHNNKKMLRYQNMKDFALLSRFFKFFILDKAKRTGGKKSQTGERFNGTSQVKGPSRRSANQSPVDAGESRQRKHEK